MLARGAATLGPSARAARAAAGATTGAAPAVRGVATQGGRRALAVQAAAAASSSPSATRGRPLLGVHAAAAASSSPPPALQLHGHARRPLSSSSSAVDSYSSSGVIIDPYLDYRHREKQAAQGSLFSFQALDAKWHEVRSKLASGVSFGHIRRHCKTFQLKGFAKTANELFIEFHDAFEKGDLRRLTAICTEDLFLNLKAQVKMKKDRPARRVLRFIAFTQPTIIVHGRHLYTSGGRGVRTQFGYGQVTVVVSSRREEFDVDARGKRVQQQASASAPGAKGKGAAIFDNESIVVLEVAFSDPKGRWRIASIVEEERKKDAASSAMITEPVGL